MFSKHDGDGNEDMAKQKLYWVESHLSTCLLKLCTFLSRLQKNNNVTSPKFAGSVNGNIQAFEKFQLKL